MPAREDFNFVSGEEIAGAEISSFSHEVRIYSNVLRSKPKT